MLIIVTCLVASRLPAAETNTTKFDIDHFLTEKKALIEEDLPLTEQEKQVFWPLYDNYMNELVKLIKRRTALTKEFRSKQKTLTDKQARAIIDEHFDIVSESVKVQKSMRAKLRSKIPDIKILNFFLLEEKIVAAYYYFLSEHIPQLK